MLAILFAMKQKCLFLAIALCSYAPSGHALENAAMLMPGMDQFGQLQQLFSTFTNTTPQPTELKERASAAYRALAAYNTKKNQPFLKRLRVIITKLHAAQAAQMPATLLNRYDRHIRCLEKIAAVNDTDHQKAYLATARMVKKRYILLHQLDQATYEQQMIREAYAKLCKADQDRFAREYEQQRSSVIATITKLNAALLPLEQQLCADDRSTLEIYKGTTLRIGTCFTLLFLVRMVWGMLPSLPKSWRAKNRLN